MYILNQNTKYNIFEYKIEENRVLNKLKPRREDPK